MLNSATYTMGRQQWWLSAISKAPRITKSYFVHSQLERDRAVTQLEEPFSEDNMMDLYKDGNRAQVAKHHRSQ